MSVPGHFRKSRPCGAMSVSPPRADIGRTFAEVRLVTEIGSAGLDQAPIFANQFSKSIRRANHPTVCQAALDHNILIFRNNKISLYRFHPVSIRRGVGQRLQRGMGCGGTRRRARRAMPRRTAKSCGPDISTLVSSLWVKSRR